MLFLFCSLAVAELHSPQAFLENAVFADVPPEGLNQIAGLMPGIIPGEIEIPSTQEGSSGFGFEFNHGWVNLDVTTAQLIPNDGYLDLNIDLEIQINDPNDQFQLDYEFFWVPSTCNGHVNTFPANVTAKVYIVLEDLDGDGIKDANVEISEDLQVTYQLTNDKISLENGSNCSVDSINDIVGWFGGDLYEFILSLVPINDLLLEEIPELEETLEEAFNEVNIEEEVELMDATINLRLTPNDLTIVPEGIRWALNGQAVTEGSADCIADFDPGGSLKTDNESDLLTDFPPGYDFGLIVTDDFINQALYSAWRSGVLCQTIDEDIFALDTSILNLVTGDALEHLFSTSQAMVIETSPRKTLVLNTSTSDDVAVDIEDLGLDFITTVNGREVRVLAMDLDAPVGLGLEVDTNSGELSPELNIDSTKVTVRATQNEFAPTRAADIEASFVDQLDTILGLVDLDGLLAELELVLPAISNGNSALGLQSVDFDASGPQGEDLGVYGIIGEVSYGSEGCGSDSELGCSVRANGETRPNGRTLLLLGLGLLGMLRRRQG